MNVFDMILTVHLLQYVEIKCQLDATAVFIANLIACSTCFRHHYAHHQKLKRFVQQLLPVLFGAVVFKLLVWYGVEGYVYGLQDAPIHSRGCLVTRDCPDISEKTKFHASL